MWSAKYIYLIIFLIIFSLVKCSMVLDIFKHKKINNIIFVNYKMAKEIREMYLNESIKLSFLKVKEFCIIPVSFSRVGIVINSNKNDWKQVFNCLQLKTGSIFKSPFVWLLVTNDIVTVNATLSSYPIEIDSDFMVAFQRDKHSFVIYEAYNTGFNYNGVMVIKEIGFWHSNYGLQIQIKSDRKDLSGVVIKCAVVVTQNLKNVIFEKYLEGTKDSVPDSLHRFKFYFLLSYLQEIFRFSFKFQRTKSWGYYVNGSFDGAVGALQRRQTDFAGMPLLFQSNRIVALEYATETWRYRPVFVMRHPKNPGGYLNIYTRPLTNEAWSCMLAILVMLSITLTYLVKFNTLKLAGDIVDDSVSIAWLTIWGAVCQQSPMINRTSTTIKLVIFITFLFSLIIYQYYNAAVVSTLLKSTPKNIRTLRDLTKSDLKVGVDDVLYIRDFFKRTTDPIALELYNKKISTAKHQNFFTPEHGMALVKRGGFAFHIESSLAYRIMRRTFTEKELCEAHEVPLIPAQNMGAVVKKGLPYKEYITQGIRRIFEAGLAQRLQAKWDEPRPVCPKSTETLKITVSIGEFSLALLVLVFGVIISFLIFICELITHSKLYAQTKHKLITYYC